MTQSYHSKIQIILCVLYFYVQDSQMPYINFKYEKYSAWI